MTVLKARRKGTDLRDHPLVKRAEEHRINWGRLAPGASYKADCTCGWSCEGSNQEVRAAITHHEDQFLSD